MKRRFSDDPLYNLKMKEDRRIARNIGIVVGIIFLIFFLIIAKDVDWGHRIPLAAAFAWTAFNAMTYRGRYRPKIVYAVKICYPVLLLIFFWVMTGTE